MRRLLPYVLVAVLAGCSAPVAGTPTAVPPEAPPARPRELRLDGVDPCALLTAAQRDELGVGHEPRRRTKDVGPVAGPECSYVRREGARRVGISIALVTDAGIDEIVPPDADAAVYRRVLVSGFPAVTFDAFGVCFVEVDVAEGQVLDVGFDDAGTVPPLSTEELCAFAARSADLAVTSAVAR